MPIYNFGMLTAGMPDPYARQASAPIRREDYYKGQQDAWLSDWQTRFDSAPAPWIETRPAGDRNAAYAAYDGALDQGVRGWADPGWDATQNDDQNWGIINAAYKGDVNARQSLENAGVQADYSSGEGYHDESARNVLRSERERQEAEFARLAAERVKNQQTQQDAYRQMQGGGFSGGMLGGGYATGATGTTVAAGDPAAGPTMPWQQPWGVPSYGGPNGGTSVAGYGSGWGAPAEQGLPQGWGGPFANKNPWAAS